MALENSKEIAVVGSGYVGLVTGACFAELGHKVTCIDNDKTKIEKLKKGIMPIYEPGLEELVSTNTAIGNLRFTDDIAEGTKDAEIVFICVGTPPREDGSPDLSAVEKVAKDIAKTMTSYKLIVEKSTVPVKTGDWLKSVMEKHITNVEFDIASNPEFLREGSAIHDSMHPDRIVIGSENARAKELLSKLYEPLNPPFHFVSLKDAELIKHSANAYLSMKISFANMISRLCDETGADVKKVMAGVGADKRIGKEFLNAGLGFGGFCFPKDLAALIKVFEEHKITPDLLYAVEKINSEQRKNFSQKMIYELGGVEKKTIGILGLAFKPNTDDMRLAPSIDIINHLQEKGAIIKAYDPQGMDNAKKILKDVEFVNDPYEAARGASAVAVVTEWPVFSRMNLVKMKDLMTGNYFFDGRNIQEPDKMRSLGFRYFGIGRK